MQRGARFQIFRSVPMQRGVHSGARNLANITVSERGTWGTGRLLLIESFQKVRLLPIKSPEKVRLLPIKSSEKIRLLPVKSSEKVRLLPVESPEKRQN